MESSFITVSPGALMPKRSMGMTCPCTPRYFHHNPRTPASMAMRFYKLWGGLPRGSFDLAVEAPEAGHGDDAAAGSESPRRARACALSPSGTEILVAGEAPGGEVKIRQWHNERSADWNTLEIEERDGSLRVWVNGLLQNEATGMSDALTTFGLRIDRTPIDWRNLMLEPLPGARVAPPLTAK